MNSWAPSNLSGDTSNFGTFLTYGFDYFLSDHIRVLGNRQDVHAARDWPSTSTTFGPTFWIGLPADASSAWVRAFALQRGPDPVRVLRPRVGLRNPARCCGGR